MSPRHVPATQAELSRIGLLAELPGEQLVELAKQMRREDVRGGEAPIVEGEEGDRFYVILNGVFAVSNLGSMPRRMLRPGDYFGEVALTMDIPRTANAARHAEHGRQLRQGTFDASSVRCSRTTNSHSCFASSSRRPGRT
jgi:hypothetical protein